MANVFDQFDGGNVFDQFDAPKRRTPSEMTADLSPSQRVMTEAVGGLKYGIPGAVLKGMQAITSPISKAIERAPYEAGGAVTDIATKIGLPPEAAAGAGYATNVSLQALPMLAGGEVAKAASVPLKALSREWMQSALKPSIRALQSGEAQRAVETLLEKGVNVTSGGVRKLKAEIDAINTQIKSAIANSPATVSKGEVGKRLVDTWNQFIKQANPNADLNAVKNAWMEFRNHPLLRGRQDIPVQLAQELKQGTYKQLSKKYGEMKGADVESQKAIARGLKEEIASAVPQIAGLNKEESKLINALNLTERRALMELNKNPAGLSLLAHNPSTWAAFMADRSGLFKSVAARMINAGAEQIPATAARAGIGGTISLQQLSPNANP